MVSAVMAYGGYRGYAALMAADPSQANMFYSDQSTRNVLDLYLPEATDTPPPVMLWVHGGAFMMGDKSDPQSLDSLLAAGFAVASINYRLTNEAIWPAQLDDVLAAHDFLRREGETLGIDPTRISLFGASAGGFLVTTAGAALTENGTPPAAVVDWYGPVQFTTMDADMEATGLTRTTGRNDAADSPESALIGATVAENTALADQISPLAYIANLPQGIQLPPYLIMHGGIDTFVAPAQSERLRDAVLSSPNGGGATYVFLPEGGHGSGTFQDQQASQVVVDFLTETLATN